MSYTTSVKLLDAVRVTTAAGDTFAVGDRVKMSLQFVAVFPNQETGSGAFNIEISNDGTNWVTYNRLTSNITNSNLQTDTKGAAPTLASASTSIYFVPEGDHFEYIRADVTRTTGGTYTVVLHSVVG